MTTDCCCGLLDGLTELITEDSYAVARVKVPGVSPKVNDTRSRVPVPAGVLHMTTVDDDQSVFLHTVKPTREDGEANEENETPSTLTS